ncbi:hypothetical protein [Myxococcus faecalis]|uniref:hypothetical protein n=1 Tax=Myxococcus faecalis TaxID=3115646 RepID=UPI003CF10FD0
MLNAFRHHGERRLAKAEQTIAEHKCSTPSGITASNDVRNRRGEGRGLVLNAFRHHGERRFTPAL